MQQENNKRLNSIDLLRVLAIVLVLAFHLLFEFTCSDSLRYLGFVGISLFFIVSGFLLAKKYPDLENFSPKWFFHRYIKIAPLYYLSLIMVILLFSRQAFYGSMLKNLIYHFLFIDFISEQTAYSIISPAWFLIPLIGLYILFPYLNRIMKRAPGALLIIFILMTVLRIDKGTLTGFSPFFFIGEFCFGILVAHQKKNPILLSSLLTYLIMPVMVLPFAIFYAIYHFRISVPAHAVTSFIGANTLALFLFHESFIKTALGKWIIFSLPQIPGLAVLAVATFLTITVSKKIEKMTLSTKTSTELKGNAIVVILLILVGIISLTLANTAFKEISLSPPGTLTQKGNILVLDVSSKKMSSEEGCSFLISGKAKNIGKEQANSPLIECKQIAYPITSAPSSAEIVQLANIPPGQETHFELTAAGSCNIERFECYAN
ncbi:MAG: acyltransferase [Nanoarchaeota archaeon]|nr:acyltransferase [Nanoarchaeota archaeon]MBU0977474.1 acyltransferase [Nanoarchaeota archaeon]